MQVYALHETRFLLIGSTRSRGCRMNPCISTFSNGLADNAGAEGSTACTMPNWQVSISMPLASHIGSAAVTSDRHVVQAASI